MDKNLNSIKRNSNTFDKNKLNNFGNSSYDEENHNNLNGAKFSVFPDLKDSIM